MAVKTLAQIERAFTRVTKIADEEARGDAGMTVMLQVYAEQSKHLVAIGRAILALKAMGCDDGVEVRVADGRMRVQCPIAAIDTHGIAFETAYPYSTPAMKEA